MYRAYVPKGAYVPQRAGVPKGAYVPNKGAYVPPKGAYVPTGLCSKRAYVPKKLETKRSRSVQVSHLDNVCPICFSFLARHAKSSALLALP